uniref:Uncharacterized protein n=1 Tax=Anguilla anguilla TaxID=7936 RepID=A0A0E9VDF7_ANGAN
MMKMKKYYICSLLLRTREELRCTGPVIDAVLH